MRQNRSNLFLGLLLILIGGWMFVTRQVPSVQAWLDANCIWPMWVIGAGALVFLIGLITGNPGNPLVGYKPDVFLKIVSNGST